MVQLEHNPRPWADGDWQPVARFDHQPHLLHGHDVYEEGLHMDLYDRDGSKRTVYPDYGPLPADTGRLLEFCKQRLREGCDHLLRAYRRG